MKRLAAYAIALLAFLSIPATVAGQGLGGKAVVRINRVDTSKPPSLRFFFSELNSGAEIVQRSSGKYYRLVADGLGKGTFPAIKKFSAIGEPLVVVFVLQTSVSMSETLPETKKAIKRLVKSFGSAIQVGLVAYTNVVVKRVSPASPSAVLPELEALQIEDTMTVKLPEGIADALEQLDDDKAKKKLPRQKLIVVVSDGLTADLKLSKFTDLGKRAAEQGITLHSVGFAPLEPYHLRTLYELSKAGKGSFRAVTEPTRVAAEFLKLQEEMQSQVVASMDVPDVFDGEEHDFEIRVSGSVLSDQVTITVPKAAAKAKPGTDGGVAGNAGDGGKAAAGSAEDEPEGPSTWLILGIIFGGVALITVLILVFMKVLLSRDRHRPPPPSYLANDDDDDEDEEEDQPPLPPMGINMGGAPPGPGPMEPAPQMQPMTPVGAGPAPQPQGPGPAPQSYGAMGGQEPLPAAQPPAMAPPAQQPAPVGPGPIGEGWSQPPDQSQPAMRPGTSPLPAVAPAPVAAPEAPAYLPPAGADPTPQGFAPQVGTPAQLDSGPVGGDLGGQPPAGGSSSGALALPTPDDFLRNMESQLPAMGQSQPDLPASAPAEASNTPWIDVPPPASFLQDSPVKTGHGIQVSDATNLEILPAAAAGPAPSRGSQAEGSSNWDDRQTVVFALDELQQSSLVAWIVPLADPSLPTVRIHDEFVLGADPGCHQVVPGEGVEAQHAVLDLDAQGYWLRWAAHARAQDSQLLQDGDRFRVGNNEFLFKLAIPFTEIPRAPSRLEVLSGLDKGRMYPLQEGIPYAVGGHPSCAFVVRGEGVGHRHALVIRKNDTCHLQDLGSSGGLRYDGALVGSKGIKPGQEVALGQVRLLFAHEL